MINGLPRTLSVSDNFVINEPNFSVTSLKSTPLFPQIVRYLADSLCSCVKKKEFMVKI